VAIQINLTTEQLGRAEREAHRRQAVNEARGLRGRNRAAATGSKALEMHLLGCIGEIAVAAHLGLEEYAFSESEAVRGSCDLPGGIEVKTRPRHGYDLLVQLDDDPSKLFVLVTHERGGATQIVGWARGHDVMRKEWVRELVRGRPCYVVPHKALQPPETLVEVGLAAPSGRVLGSHQVWTTECENGDVILNFSDELVAELGWEVGDVLTYDVDPVKCQCVITKAVERNTKGPDPERPGVAGTT
jgi:hypothetical protein